MNVYKQKDVEGLKKQLIFEKLITLSSDDSQLTSESQSFFSLITSTSLISSKISPTEGESSKEGVSILSASSLMTSSHQMLI